MNPRRVAAPAIVLIAGSLALLPPAGALPAGARVALALALGAAAVALLGWRDAAVSAAREREARQAAAPGSDDAGAAPPASPEPPPARAAEPPASGPDRDRERKPAGAESLLPRRLVRAAAHEINNQLTAVLAQADLLAPRVADEPIASGHVERIRSASERMVRLARHLLDLGATGELAPEPRSLDAALTELEPILRHLGGTHVRVQTRAGAPDTPVLAPAGAIERAVLLLVLSEYAGSTAPGRVTIETRPVTLVDASALALGLRDGAYLQLRVALRHERPASVDEVGGGSDDDAVAAMKALAASGGGAVAVTSEDASTRVVTLWWPAAATASPSTLATSASGETAAQILLVEDEPMVRSFIAEALRREGHHVLDVADAEAGAAVLASGVRVDGLITDVRLPGMSGPALVRHARDLRPGLPALYVTGFGGDESLVRGSGDDAPCLLKPFRAAALAEAVATMLNRPSGTA